MFLPAINEFDNPERSEWNADAESAYWQLRSEQSYTEVEEITLTTFMDAIALMYPKDWQGDAHCESFKLAEMYCGDVTEIYAKVGEKYFTFRDKVTLTHEAIIDRINRKVQAR